jgi:hypothetical protein
LIFSQAVFLGLGHAVAILFAFASLEKLRMLFTRTASWHPILLRIDPSRRYASLLVASAALLDLVGLLLLYVSPRTGSILLLIGLGAYSATALQISAIRGGKRQCQCLGSVFDAPSGLYFTLRNLIVGVVLVAIMLEGPSDLPLGPAALFSSGTLLLGLAISAKVIRLGSNRRHAGW